MTLIIYALVFEHEKPYSIGATNLQKFLGGSWNLSAVVFTNGNMATYSAKIRLPNILTIITFVFKG